MCGILGLVGGSGRPIQLDRAYILRHRGPDAFGEWSDGDAWLGHNRLAIIDLSAAANQPMRSPDEAMVIVFNGEIYNHRELRAELQADGYQFATVSDTEVLLKGYRCWGAALLDRLEGMFAFAIWDPRRRVLFAARDHAGIKPFFYALHDGAFAFGSEIKAVQWLVDAPTQVRDASIYEYLVYGYVPAPYTAYAGLMRLPAGHWLEFNLSTSALTLQRWWRVPVSHPRSESLGAAAERMRSVLARTIAGHMIADVPVGVFLSGGLDSSVLVAEMAASGRSFETFTVGFRANREYDETQYARTVSQALGIDHSVIYPEVDSHELSRYLDLVVGQFDEPYSNPTAVLTFLLTAASRDRVKVALVGDGGDEVFAGYPRHRALVLAERLRPVLRPFAPLALRALGMLRETPSGNHRRRRLRQFLDAMDKSSASSYQLWSSLFPAHQVEAFARATSGASDGFRPSLIADLCREHGIDALSDALYADLNSFLPFNLLEGADRMSMANGFELRVPFVARDVIEASMETASNLKIHLGRQKAVLRHAYRGALPSAILQRRKRGFNPPVWQWLQDNPDLLRDRLLRPGPVHRYVPLTETAAMVASFGASRVDNSSQLWMLLVLDTWLRQVDAKPCR